MLYIIGSLVVLSIVFLILNRFLEGTCTAVWIIALLSSLSVISVLAVWGLEMVCSARDYDYIENHLQVNGINVSITDKKAAKLFIEYKDHYRYWINRQFSRTPSRRLQKLFEKHSRLKVHIELDENNDRGALQQKETESRQSDALLPDA